MSPATTARGLPPTATRVAAEKFPSFVPRNTDTSFEPLLATAMSGTRSPSKSATATDTGSEPASSSSAGRKENVRQTDGADAAGRVNETAIERRRASAARRVEMFTTNAPYGESDDGKKIYPACDGFRARRI